MNETHVLGLYCISKLTSSEKPPGIASTLFYHPPIPTFGLSIPSCLLLAVALRLFQRGAFDHK